MSFTFQDRKELPIWDINDAFALLINSLLIKALLTFFQKKKNRIWIKTKSKGCITINTKKASAEKLTFYIDFLYRRIQNSWSAKKTSQTKLKN